MIVAAEVTNQGADAPQLPGLVEQMVENTGRAAQEASVDAGYYSQANVAVLEQKGIEAFIPPDKLPCRWRREPAPRGRIPRQLSTADRMRRKLRTKRGTARYQLRQETVEPVFGQIKEARGFRRFSLRGLEKVRAEWQLVCLTHNVLKLAAQRRAATLKQAS